MEKSMDYSTGIFSDFGSFYKMVITLKISLKTLTFIISTCNDKIKHKHSSINRLIKFKWRYLNNREGGVFLMLLAIVNTNQRNLQCFTR